MGCAKVDIWDSLSKDVNAFREVDHKLPTTKDSLRYKVTKYAKEGYPAVISGKFGMQNALKVKEREQEALIDELLAKHTNLDDAIDRLTLQYGWRTLKLAIDDGSNYWESQKAESNLVIYAGRNGVSALSNNMLMQSKRQAPSTPMLYWTLDGWDARTFVSKTSEGDSKRTNKNDLSQPLNNGCCSRHIQ
ncbi:hypothetical protein [Flavobacterium sp. GNP001]